MPPSVSTRIRSSRRRTVRRCMRRWRAGASHWAAHVLPRPSSTVGSSTSRSWRAKTAPRSFPRRRSGSMPTRRERSASSATVPSGRRAPSSLTTRRGHSNFPRRMHRSSHRLKELALRCWRSFSLRGYARVDFRVDRRGPPLDSRGEREPLSLAGRGLLRGDAARRACRSRTSFGGSSATFPPDRVAHALKIPNSY